MEFRRSEGRLIPRVRLRPGFFFCITECHDGSQIFVDGTLRKSNLFMRGQNIGVGGEVSEE
jgi:hypothetical protein